MHRRQFLSSGGCALIPSLAHGQSLSEKTAGLQSYAAAKGLAFGAAINITSFRGDPLYRSLIAADCGVAVAENEMKMEYVWPEPDRFAFQGADETAAFTQKRGIKLRGTVLVWHNGMPGWAFDQIRPATAEPLMRRWISTIAGRFRGQIESWDVVNEILDASQSDGLRRTPWREALGPDYIPLAFHMLHDIDPAAAGVWNEEDLELDIAWMDRRRESVLKILDRLLARKTPIKRIGLQSHLNSLIPLNQKKLRTFLADIASMGLAIEITELDVDDRAFPIEIEKRDIAVASLVKNYLDVILDEAAVLNILTWDILDANTWYNTSNRRRLDGFPQRSLPYDQNSNPKPMWTAIQSAFISGPDFSHTRKLLR